MGTATTVLRVHAPTTAASSSTIARPPRAVDLAIDEILPDAAQVTARNIGDDRDVTIACFVLYDARVSIEPRDALAVAGIGRIERQGQPPHVERDARGNCFHEIG